MIILIKSEGAIALLRERIRAFMSPLRFSFGAVIVFFVMSAPAMAGDTFARGYFWSQATGNLISNWSFENELDSWTDATANGITVKARDSAMFAAKTGRYIGSASGTTSYNVWIMLLKQPRIRIVPGQPYTLSFYVRSSGSIGTGIYPAVRHLSAKGGVATIQNGKAYSVYADSATGSPQFPSWTLYRLHITPNDTTQYLELALFSSVAPGTGATLGFDDIVLEEGRLGLADILERRSKTGYSVSFLDAAGRSHQTHVRLPEDPGVFRVSGTVFDSAGRPLKSPLPFPRTQISPTVVGDLVGAANSYYAGAGAPSANGYAYTEVQYAAEPSSRVVKSASPGQPWRLAGTKILESGFWFTDTLSVPAKIKNPDMDGQERNYRLDWGRDEDSVFSLSWTNRRGQVVQVAQKADSGWALTRMEYYPAGQVRKIRTPLNIRFGGEAFTEVRNYNAAGLLTSSYTHDRGLEKFWYNVRGMLRYSQNDQQKAGGSGYVYTYMDYDHLGNMRATGEQTVASLDPSQESVVDGNGELYPWGKQEAKGWLYGTLAGFEGSVGVPLDSVTWPAAIYPRFRANALVAAWNRNLQAPVPGLDSLRKLVVDFYEYDSLGRLGWQHKYLGAMAYPNRVQSAFFEYDEVGRLVDREAFEAGSPSLLYSAQHYAYDALGRVTEARNTGSAKAGYQYEPHGPLKKVSLGNDSVVTSTLDYQYHIRGWAKDVTATRLQDGSQTYRQVLGYENKALSHASVPGLAKPLYTGQITQQLYKYTSDVAAPVRAVNYSYDAQGRMSTADYHQGTGLNAGQALQFPLSLVDTNLLATRLAYDVNGRILGKRSGGVASVDSARYFYQGDSYRLESVQGKLEETGDRDASRFENFQYDAAGNMIRDLSKGLSISYGYDGMPSSMAVQRGESETVLYPLYDAGGYRVTQITAARQAHNYPVYIVGSDSGGVSGFYDALTVGHALSDANYRLNFMGQSADTVRLYIVQAAGQKATASKVFEIRHLYKGEARVPVVLHNVERGGIEHEALLALHEGRRLYAAHTVNLDGWQAAEIRELYDTLGGVADRQVVGALYGRGMPIGRVVHGDTGAVYQFYVKNHLGSTARVVNVDGSYATTPTFDYQAYGELQAIREDWANPVMQKFTGKGLDSTVNLYYFGARWYDQELGMWNTVDPIVQYFHPYGFGYGDPINGIDPNGMAWAIFRPSKWRNFAVDAWEGTKTTATKFDRFAGGYGKGDQDNIWRQMYRAATGRSGATCANTPGGCTEETRESGLDFGFDVNTDGDWVIRLPGQPPAGPGSDLVKNSPLPDNAGADAVAVAENRANDPCANASACIYAPSWYYDYNRYAQQAFNSVPVQLAMFVGFPEARMLGFADDVVRGVRALPFKDPGLSGRVSGVLDDISNGVRQYSKDGTVFKNFEGRLPSKPIGYYKEYTVPTPGAMNRGSQRVIQGGNGERYFTPDHYKTFIRIPY